MSQVFVSFVIGLVVGGGVVWYLLKNKKAQKHGDVGGIAKFAQEQADKKQENKQKILEFLRGREEITNNDVENLISVSNTTAWRYLDELEKEGVLRQVGDTGKEVYYKKI